MARSWLVASLVAACLLVACRSMPGESRPTETEDAAPIPAPVTSTPRTTHPPVAAPTLVALDAAAEPAPAVAEPPPPPPEPFAGQEHVRVDALWAELDRVAEQMAQSPTVRADFDVLRLTHDLPDDEALYRDYVRVKLAFEATRDGGWWHMRWAITNQKPNSDRVWAQWKRAAVPSDDDPAVPTAIAECDELSALFALVARNLGVRHIGLFWPQWNHVVAVWSVQSSDGSTVRIVVPTSQIFLTLDDSLGTDRFDPWTQKTIFEYRRQDVKGSHRIPAELARFFVVQAQRHGGRSQVEQQALRNARDLAMTAAEEAAG